MSHLVFFLEERSAREMLEQFLPKILPNPGNVATRYVIFEGKQDMNRQLERKLRYWRAPNTCFVVMQDKDQEDCHDVKDRLVRICQKANKPNALVRILCHELESWYLGDLKAVEKGLQIPNLAQKQQRKQFRNPDQTVQPARELRKLTQSKYQKIAGSRAIGGHLSTHGNRSHSFGVFVSGIQRLIQDCACP